MALRVVEDGNRRVGDMTPAELEQCVLGNALGCLLACVLLG
jgi:hypothetical protein